MRRVVVAYLEVSKGGENTRFYVRRRIVFGLIQHHEWSDNDG